MAKKTLETLELEQLRKINNDLEEAHKVLESHLYRDLRIFFLILELKENIIEELASRYNSQKSNLLQQSEQLKNLLKEKALFENKPKSSTRDQAEIELLKQNVRVLQTNADEKKVQLERFKIDFAGAKDETQLLLVLYNLF